MNVPCHAIEKRVKIGNKASSQVNPTDFNTSSSTWVEEPDYKASHRFTFYRLTVSIVIEQIGAFHNLMMVKSNLVTLNPFQQLQVTANEMRAKKSNKSRPSLTVNYF